MLLWIGFAISAASLAGAQQPIGFPQQPAPAGTTLPTAQQGANGVSTTAPIYTSFDLFKNSGFTSCQINANTTADPTTTSFIVSRNVATQQEFCSFLAGTPILIPTTPTNDAFFPWYPTLLAQAFSLLLSYVGIFFTLRHLDRSRMQTTKRVPWSFWVQLPFDIGRFVAFFLAAFRGFLDSSKFTWVNVVLWLLPLNYVTILIQLRNPRRDNLVVEEPYAGASQQVAQLRVQQQQGLAMGESSLLTGSSTGANSKSPFWLSDGGRRPSSTLASLSGQPQASTGPKNMMNIWRRRTSWGAGVWTWVVLTAFVWFLSFVEVILHWKFSFGAAGSSFTRMYVPVNTALISPRTIGDMPLACIRYLESGSLPANQFFSQNTDQLMFSLLTTLQFLFSTSVVGLIAYDLRRGAEPFDRAYRVLYATAALTMVLILIPAFAVGIDIAVKVNARREVINMRFTNNLQVTGGCTFAFVNMNKRKGYWDVGLNLAARVVNAFLGAA